MKEQTRCATHHNPLPNLPNEKKKKKRNDDLTLSVRIIISGQVNEGTVFADRCLLFSAEGIIQQ